MDGSIIGSKLDKRFSTDLDREAKRRVRDMSACTPVVAGCKKLGSRCRLPILFTLQ